jgi:hypothetical protein
MQNQVRVLVAAFVMVVALGAELAAQTLSAPTNVGVSVIGTVVTLSWNAPSSGTVTSYVIEVGSAPGLTNLLTHDTGNPSTVFVADAPIGVYYVRIRARSGAIVSLPSQSITVPVPTVCSSRPGAPYIGYTVTGSTVTLRWGGGSFSVGSRSNNVVFEAGTSVFAGNIARIVLPNSGQSMQSFSLTAPPGAYFVRATHVNACGVSTRSNEQMVLVGNTTGATGRWRGRVLIGLIPWDLDLDLQLQGANVIGTYYFAVDDVPVENRESWGIVTGTATSSGALQLTLNAYGPPESFPSNPGGTFSGVFSAAGDRINGTLVPIRVSGIPIHNPTFVMLRY